MEQDELIANAGPRGPWLCPPGGYQVAGGLHGGRRASTDNESNGERRVPELPAAVPRAPAGAQADDPADVGTEKRRYSKRRCPLLYDARELD